MIEETTTHDSAPPASEGLVNPALKGEVVAFPTPPQSAPQPPPPFVTLSLSPVECLLTYQAYRVLLKHYAGLDNEPLDNIQQLVALLSTIKPGAVEASRLIQGGSQQ